MTAIANIRTAGTLVERVTPLLDVIRPRAPEIEANRQLPRDIIDQLIDIGYMRAMMPVERGGGEEDLVDWLQATRLLSAADMATGWVAGLLSCHANSLTYFDTRVQDEIWADGPDLLIGSAGAPTGKATPVPGGVRLSGRFPFSSGSDFCKWSMFGFVLDEASGHQPGFYLCMVPASDFRLEDDWFTSGLRGSGSKSVIIEDVFVPQYRWFGPGLDHGPMSPGTYRNPMFNSAYLVGYNAPFAAIMLGGAEGALQAAVDSLKGRTKSAITAQRTVEFAPRQMRVAEAALEIRGAAALIEKNWAWIADSMRDGRTQTVEEIRWWRGEDAHAVRRARHAVDQLMNDAGGSAQYAHRPLQRFWRDIHVGCEHPWLDLLASTTVIGRSMLGLPLDPAQVI